MTPQKVFKIAREYQETYNSLKNMGMTNHLREETAKRLGFSTPQADRYRKFNDLIPEIQNLIYDYNVGMSSLLVIAPHTLSEQKEIYEILMGAQSEGVSLIRNFVKQAVNSYRDGKHCWQEIKTDCSSFMNREKTVKKHWHRKIDTDLLEEVRNLSGEDFELWFADLLRTNGYVAVNITQHSFDKGADVVAIKDNVQYIFQCKNTPNVGIRALQEIWFAKRDIDHVPVVVTTGTISTATRKIADERGIQCWTGQDLARLSKT